MGFNWAFKGLKAKPNKNDSMLDMTVLPPSQQ